MSEIPTHESQKKIGSISSVSLQVSLSSAYDITSNANMFSGCREDKKVNITRYRCTYFVDIMNLRCLQKWFQFKPLRPGFRQEMPGVQLKRRGAMDM